MIKLVLFSNFFSYMNNSHFAQILDQYVLAKTPVAISWRVSEAKIVVSKGILLDLFYDQGRMLVLMQTGMQIYLDQILAVKKLT